MEEDENMLTQAAADHLIEMLKKIDKPKLFLFPLAGDRRTIDVVSLNGRENFIMDIQRSRIKISKCTYQNRYRKDIILLRLDLGGSPHTNPDGVTIACPHLHIYKEGFEDRWAYALPDEFSVDEDLITKLIEFLEYCKIQNTDKLCIQGVI
jgi:hypothetical protein